MDPVHRECLICSKDFIPSKFAATRQVVCNHASCRKEAKKIRQSNWTAKNPDYFRGPEHVERVRQWRKTHPDWRTSVRGPTELPAPESSPKAESCNTPTPAAIRLQDSALQRQEAIVLGVISIVAGDRLQDEVLTLAEECFRRGSALIRARAPSESPTPIASTQSTHGKIPNRPGSPPPFAFPF
jgi:hypothetical protein